jgi:RNA polymerase sigma factor (sigma-70 family)
MSLALRSNTLLPSRPNASWDDEALLAACREGDQAAWNALVDRHKNLIYSIPIRYRLGPDAASDIFQDVCLILYEQLDSLRDGKALRGWLARVAANESFRRRQGLDRISPEETPDVADPAVALPDWLEEVERYETVREGLAQLTPRCREMMKLLFYADPPKPYQEVAKELGLAIGSIGFIRGRCLRQLERNLKTLGL